IVSVRPPLELIAFQREVTFRPLNERGAAINRMLATVLRDHQHWDDFREENATLHGTLKPMPKLFAEEERSRQPSVFSILRALTREFRSEHDNKLAFAGAFGYDLLFQFEPIPLRLPRDTRKDLQLFLCDDIIYMDRKREQIERFTFEFEQNEVSTRGLDRTGERIARAPVREPGPITSDHTPEEYMANVEVVREGMRRGDYYEVILSQTFRTAYSGKASELFTRMQRANPSPYEFLIQFGDEQLVGASPEMLVRVDGPRVETCPISGTARRTGDPLQDEKNIRALLTSTKEESELTMCTDVDRNDKSRVCVPGTVKVIGRRQIEMYSRLIHTVDHVEGRLQTGFDALDAFLTHMWAVTVTGAPKHWAMQFIEDHEATPRRWYGGAVGAIGFDGGMNTGLTLRTAHIRDGIAAVRAGATLLFDSIPEAEEKETHIKARALLEALREAARTPEGSQEG